MSEHAMPLMSRAIDEGQVELHEARCKGEDL
jgi:hypothetical protein